MIGSFDRHLYLTLVDRKTGYVVIGKLFGRTARATNRRATSLIRQAPRRTLFHCGQRNGVSRLQETREGDGRPPSTSAPHRSWERYFRKHHVLIRQYLPKRTSMANVTQRDCTRIAVALNSRRRKRLGYLTPAEIYERKFSTSTVALHS